MMKRHASFYSVIMGFFYRSVGSMIVNYNLKYFLCKPTVSGVLLENEFFCLTIFFSRLICRVVINEEHERISPTRRGGNNQP